MKKILYIFLLLKIAFAQSKDQNLAKQILESHSKNALNFLLKKDYPSSIAEYQKAYIYISNIKQSKKTQKEKNELRKQIIKTYKEWIESFTSEKNSINYKQALQITNNALKSFPEQYYFKVIQSKLEKELLTQEKKIADTLIIKDSKKNQINTLFLKAKLLFTEKNYLEASHLIQEIFEIQPYNQEAIKLMDLINKRIHKIGLKRSLNQINSQNTSWNKVFSIKKNNDLNQSQKTRRYYNIPNIKLENISFKKTKIKDIISSLEQKIQDQTNLSFLIIDKEVAQKRISLNLNKVSLKEILESISFLSNSSYFRQLDKIILTNQKKLTQNLITREFIIGNTELEAFESIDEDNEEAHEDDNENNRIKKLFQSLGITFSEDAQVSYSPKNKKLIVRSTPENLKAIDNIIATIKNETQQIFIQTQFMEITETLFKEINFLWDINIDNSNLKDVSSFNPTSGLRNLDANQNNLDLQSDLSSSSLNLSNLRLDVSKLFKIGSISGAQVSFLTRLISQDNNSNLIFAPKILTASGNSALIESTTERLLPFDWSQASTNLNSTRATINYPKPNFNVEPIKLGVSFSATPNIQPDGFTIEIFINPAIRELIGFDNYTEDAQTNAINVTQLVNDNVVAEVNYYA